MNTITLTTKDADMIIGDFRDQIKFMEGELKDTKEELKELASLVNEIPDKEKAAAYTIYGKLLKKKVETVAEERIAFCQKCIELLMCGSEVKDA